MNNVHNLNDNRQNPAGQNPFANIQRKILPQMSKFPKDPREESFTDMMRFQMFPNLTVLSFSFLLILVLVLVFSAQVALDGLDKSQLRIYFLPINLKGPFSSFFENNFAEVFGSFQIWRLFTSLFLSESFLLLFTSVTSVLFFVCMFETLLTANYVKLYFLFGGIMGNVVGLALTQNQVQSTGPVVGVYAVFGAVFGFLLFNWRNLESTPDVRTLWTTQVLMVTVLSYLSVGKQFSPVFLGGGLVSGFFGALTFSENVDNQPSDLSWFTYQGILRRVGVLYCVLVGILLGVVGFMES